MAVKRKKKVVKNPRVPRTHNGGTQTKSQFFGSIIASLRQLSRWYKPIQQVKQAAKRNKPANIKGKHRVEFQCNVCKSWVLDKNCDVDHLIEVGGIRDFCDIQGFCERLFCSDDGLQLICKPCHYIKTQAYMKKRRELKKGGNNEE